MKWQTRAGIRKGRRDRLAFPGWQGGPSYSCTVTAPPCQPGSAHLTIQPGTKGSIGTKMEENTLEVELKRKREKKGSVKENNMLCLAIHAFWGRAFVNECPWHRAAQGTAASWGGRDLAAKARILLPSYQHCTGNGSGSRVAQTPKQHWFCAITVPIGRCWPYLTRMGAGAGHSRHMAERLTASMCWVESQPLISQAGNMLWAAHTEPFTGSLVPSQQLLCSLPSIGA